MRSLPLLLIACSGGSSDDGTTDTGPTAPDTDTQPPPTGDPPEGECGDVTRWDLTVRGTVVGASGSPAIGAAVRLEERAWHPMGADFGAATTDGTGRFELAASQVVSVEDCWATALDYVLVGELGTQAGEKDMNTWLFSAIEDGTLVADLTTPLELEEP